MQKLAELTQMAHIDKIHQKAKLGRMVLSPQTSEDSETQKMDKPAELAVSHWITLFLAVLHPKKIVLPVCS